MKKQNDQNPQKELPLKKPVKKHVEKIVGKSESAIRRSGCIPQGI